jgi:putative aldouronate transport system permease protein
MGLHSLKKIKINGEFFLDLFIYVFMAFVFVAMIYPFLNVLALSFNNSSDSIRGGIYIWPRKFTLKNYTKLIEYPNLPRAAINSVMRTVLGTALGVIATSMASFVLSRRDFLFRKPATLAFTISMYVSGGIVPFYLLIRNLGLMGNFFVYIFPPLVIVYCVILMRTYIDSLPLSLQESAMIDGASDFYIYLRIIMPLCLPSIATIVLFYSVMHWNDWWYAYLYNSRATHLTVLQFELQKILIDTARAMQPQPGEDMMRRMEGVTPRSIQMTITVVVTTPILFVYPFIQKYFIKGMVIGAVKG